MDIKDNAARMMAASEIVHPIPVISTAISASALWAFTGYLWPVAVSGLVATITVRLTLDPHRWGEHSAKGELYRARFATKSRSNSVTGVSSE